MPLFALDVNGWNRVKRTLKYFHILEKWNAKINSIYKLNINQHICEDPQKISNFVEDVDRRLYTEPDKCHSTWPFFAALKVTDIDHTEGSLWPIDICRRIGKMYSAAKS